jgi:mannose-6-phosphate isomerase-like protein (cupin superfamily)
MSRMSDYTKLNLREVEDSAPKFGLGEIGEARFARRDLEASFTGISLQSLNPHKRQAFGHKHANQEEVYVIVRGSGRMKIDDEVFDVRQWDAIRVGPDAIRAFEAGSDGLELIAFGAPVAEQPDVEMLQGWWE